MEKICIFTDSTSDITPIEARRWNIDVVPILLTVGDKTYREFYDITPQQYWEILDTREEIPQTSQIPMEELQSQFERAHAQGCTHCVGVLINGAGSGSFQTACIVRDMFYEEHGRDMVIELIDSRCYAYMYGSIVVHGAKMREEGASFEEIVTEMRRQIRTIRAYLGVYSLKYLKKSGRISGGAAFVGEALGMKAISLVADGSVDVCAKVRGEKNLVNRMVKLAAENADTPSKQTAILFYTLVNGPEIDRAEQLLLEAGFAAVHRTPLGAAVTTNAGPHSVAIGFHVPEEVD